MSSLHQTCLPSSSHHSEVMTPSSTIVSRPSVIMPRYSNTWHAPDPYHGTQQPTLTVQAPVNTLPPSQPAIVAPQSDPNSSISYPPLTFSQLSFSFSIPPPALLDREEHSRKYQRLNTGRARQTMSRSISAAPLPDQTQPCLLYTSPSPRDATLSRMPSSA